MKKILLFLGTRPEAVKMAPLIKELQKHTESIKSVVCITAQHREMLDQVLDIFCIKPDYDLNLMEDNQDLFSITSNLLDGLKKIFLNEDPNLALIQGDTTTTMAASLAAYYMKVPIGHVEAGLRTYNKYSPWPEEINRKIASCIADYHFAPTDKARDNLLSESVKPSSIFVTGNTVVDALNIAMEQIDKKQTVTELIQDHPSLGRVFFSNNHIKKSFRFILVTGHRRENFGKGLENICCAIHQIASIFPDIDIIWPVHLNPNVLRPVSQMLGNRQNIHMVKPLDYFTFVWLMSQCLLIITDSGGVQEEAPSFGKPVLVTREVTERFESCELGTAKLVGPHTEPIIEAASALLSSEDEPRICANAPNPFGDGKASERIISICCSILSNNGIPA